jgi:hypothetical protein
VEALRDAGIRHVREVPPCDEVLDVRDMWWRECLTQAVVDDLVRVVISGVEVWVVAEVEIEPEERFRRAAGRGEGRRWPSLGIERDRSV